MSEDVLFGVDAASFQGTVNWPQVAAAGTSFGWEKVTQGTGYVNPDWNGSNYSAKSELAELGRGEFVPGAYMFLQQGDATAQVDFFVEQAGDLTNFLVAIDAEPVNQPGILVSNPTQADLNEAVRRFKYHYPDHLLSGYCPHWYWGDTSLTMFDWLWASEYVTGSGSPSSLYQRVPPEWWNSYGGRNVEMLQYTSSAFIAGMAEIDVSAYRGTVAELRQLIAVSKPPPPKPPVTNGVDTMAYAGLPMMKGNATVIPIPAGMTKIVLYADSGATEGGIAAAIRCAVYHGGDSVILHPTWDAPAVHDLAKEAKYVSLSREDDGHALITVDFS